MIDVVLNGKVERLDESCTIAALLGKLGIDGEAIAVEVNQRIVPRRAHEETRLREGDIVEIVTLVGGG
ncbi:MAG TPA: sulfur carrier protein ThiS [Planctomycetota bacterium]|nr:sulfur carrier protein ThiS [Planctomycetota bacterium]